MNFHSTKSVHLKVNLRSDFHISICIKTIRDLALLIAAKIADEITRSCLEDLVSIGKFAFFNILLDFQIYTSSGITICHDIYHLLKQGL